MLDQMFVHVLVAVLVVDRAESEGSTFLVPHNVSSDLPLPCLETFVGQVLKTESGGIVSSSLFRVPDPKGKVA